MCGCYPSIGAGYLPHDHCHVVTGSEFHVSTQGTTVALTRRADIAQTRRTMRMLSMDSLRAALLSLSASAAPTPPAASAFSCKTLASFCQDQSYPPAELFSSASVDNSAGAGYDTKRYAGEEEVYHQQRATVTVGWPPDLNETDRKVHSQTSRGITPGTYHRSMARLSIKNKSHRTPC